MLEDCAHSDRVAEKWRGVARHSRGVLHATTTVMIKQGNGIAHTFKDPCNNGTVF